MIENITNTTTADETISTIPTTETIGEPVAEATPDIDTISTTEKEGITIYMPPEYLSSGYYARADNGTKYLQPEFVDEYAQIMAITLDDMTIADFNNLLVEMKRSKKKTLPFEARLTAASELVPKALTLIHRKKAPAQLLAIVKKNLDNIHNDDDWYAYYRHLEAIAGFLVLNTDE